MVDESKIAEEKKRLKELDSLLKDVPLTNSFAAIIPFIQEFQNAMGVSKTATLDRAALEWERITLQNEINLHEAELHNDESAKLAISMHAQEQRLTPKEHDLFENLMKRGDDLKVDDFNKSISIFNNHPRSLEAVDLAAKFMDSSDAKLKAEIENRLKTDKKFDYVCQTVENRDQFFKDYFDPAKREELRRKHPDAVKVMDNLDINTKNKFKKDVDMSNHGDNTQLHKDQFELNKNNKKAGKALDDLAMPVALPVNQAANIDQSINDSIADLPKPLAKNAIDKIEIAANLPGMDDVKLKSAGSSINPGLTGSAKSPIKNATDPSLT